MQVSVESTSALERRLTIGVPASEVDTKVDERLQQVAKQAKIDGFRPGKVPMKVVRQRFGRGAREEVLGKVISDAFYKAVTQENLRPAGMPNVEPLTDENGKDFEFVATFEVYPDVELVDFSTIDIERKSAEITEQDVDTVIETLRQQNAEYVDVDRAAAKGDKVNIDFTGFRDGEEFAGGKAQGSDLELGSGQMIPGFEEGIEGMKAGEEKTIALNFPENYHAEDLKGAAVEFRIKLNKVQEKQLPALDDEFFRNFGVEEGGLDAFREEVKKNMQREMKTAAMNQLKQEVVKKLLAAHSFDIPKALLQQETLAMRQQLMQQFGGQKIDPAMLPDEMFEHQARDRVLTGLIMGEIIKQHEIKVDADAVKSRIEEMASAYHDPQEVINHYYGNQNLLASVENIVLEEQVINKVVADAKVNDCSVSYHEIMNPAPQTAPASEQAEA
ncbi:MAG: trigger factor [Pseudomonadales bacterium]|nr:trigger factor [Pseudomonadales bacterium]